VCSVDGEWIVAKKDWQEAKRREKSRERREKSKEGKENEKFTQQSNNTDFTSREESSEPGYTPDMDEQRCILYFHGGKRIGSVHASRSCSDLNSFYHFVGGYYFGSVDQERYSIQRFARKMNGRVFGECCVLSFPSELSFHTSLQLSRST
jgi:hypothetical protein